MLKSENGSAMITALIVLLVLSVLGSGLAFVLSSEGRQSVRHTNSTQAYYLARTGAEAASEYVIENYSSSQTVQDFVDNTNLTPYINVQNGSIDSITYEIESDGSIILTSKAQYNGIINSVSLRLQSRPLIGKSIFDYALFNLSESVNMDLGNNQTVVGPIGSNSGINFKNNNPNSFIFEEYAGIIDDDLPDFDWSLFDSSGPVSIPNTVTESGHYSVLNKSIIFETGSAGDQLYVRVEGFNLKGNSQVTIVGDGLLHLLVKSESGTTIFNMGGTTRIVTQDASRAIIYILDNVNVTLGGTPGLHAFLYAPYSTVTWNGGGNEKITGGVIANEFSGGNSNTSVIHDSELLKNGAFITDPPEHVGGGQERVAGFDRHLWVD